MEQKRIKVRLTKNSPYSNYGYYEKGDIGYIDGYVNDNAVIILENGKFAKADLRWIEAVNEEDKKVYTKLKESEDEKIRQAILEHIQLCTESIPDRDKFIAWLEKQYADPIKEYWRGYNEGKQNVLDKYAELKKQGKQNLANSAKTCKVEQKPADLKTKAGNWYICDMEVINENMEAAFHRDESYYCPKDGYLDVRGALFEVGDLDVFRLATEKEIPQPEQNPAWSEEDENGLGDALWCCKQAASIAKDENDMGNVWYAEHWLKSLKDRYTWKPSDRQIIELRRVISGCSYDIEPLAEMEEQLKKLREEDV